MFRELVHKADLGNGFYKNPIMNGDYADPAVFREGDHYYLTASSGPYYPGLTVFHSKDLVNWEFICHALKNFDGDVWAPDFLKYKDKYYIYFSAEGSNWVIWSDHVGSGWSDPINLKVTHIDPGHCVDRNGDRYLFLSAGMFVQLAEDGLSINGEVKEIWPAEEISDDWDVEGIFPEAPNVFQKDGYYYLTYADGGTAGPATSHSIMCARAKDIHGPWELSPYNPIVQTYKREEKWVSKGHGHFVEDTDGNWWVIYHAYENGYLPLGRKLLLSPVTFTEDGWFRITTKADEVQKKPVGKAVFSDRKLSDDFKFGLNESGWRSFGKFDKDRYYTTELGLRIDGVEKEIGESNPISLITGDHSYKTSVHVKVQPESKAGLILQYDHKIFHAISLDEGRLTVYRLGRQLASIPYDKEECWLMMHNDEHYVSFYYSEDGTTYKKMNYVIDTTGHHTNSFNRFLSLRPGIFSVGNSYAEFAEFRYEGIK